MTYILMIWTVVAMAGAPGGGIYAGQFRLEKDWRPIAEFHADEGRPNKTSAQAMCEAGARELGLKAENYRCVRTK